MLKYYVDRALFYWLHELSLLRLDPDRKLELDEQDSIIPNSTLTSPKTIIEIATKSYADSLHEINRIRRDLFLVFKDQDNEFDNNKLSSLDIVTVNTDPRSDNELSNKKIVDDSIGEGTIVRFSQALQNYLKVSVGNDTYNLTKYDKKQITDTTIIKSGNTGVTILPYGKNVCNDKNTNGKLSNFNKSTKKQTLQQVNQDRRVCLQLVMRLCVSKQAVVTTVIMYFLVLNELILFKLLIKHFIIIVFQRLMLI